MANACLSGSPKVKIKAGGFKWLKQEFTRFYHEDNDQVTGENCGVFSLEVFKDKIGPLMCSLSGTIWTSPFYSKLSRLGRLYQESHF